MLNKWYMTADGPEKKCARCGLVLLQREYYRKGAQGRDPTCKECRRAIYRERYQNDPAWRELLAERKREYVLTHKRRMVKGVSKWFKIERLADNEHSRAMH